MVKVEDQTIIRPEALNTADCPICGESIKWGGDSKSYVALHCDRSLSAEPELYRISMTKLTPENINQAIEANLADEPSEEVVEEEKSEGKTTAKTTKTVSNKPKGYGYKLGVLSDEQDDELGLFGDDDE